MTSQSKTCKALVVYGKPATFITNDIEILRRRCTVRPFQYIGKRNLMSLGGALLRSRIVYCWFTIGYATTSVLLSRILRKKSVVVAGGWDVIYLPEIDYGAMKSKKRIKKTSYALRKADRVIAVSESTKREVLQWVDRDVDVVYNAVDTNRFVPKGDKQDLVVMVGAVGSLTRYKKKGIETLMKAAARLPEVEFAIVGGNYPEWDKKLRELAPDNVTITGRVPDAELLSLYQSAKVYAQISFHESFGVAVAEAMSCGCIPVVTERSALPEVVGDTGFYAEYGDIEGTVEAIRKAMDSKNQENCRKRVQENFSFEIRESKLNKIIDEVLSG
jgi:glycosyltransferase involved in cell wall biosynthesis